MMNFNVNGSWRLWLIMLFCVLCAGSSKISISKNKYVNATSVLDSLLSTYDKRFRPNFGGPPVEIQASLLIMSIVPINEVDMEFTTVFYLRQEWMEPRLAYGDLLTQPSITLIGDVISEFWFPDSFFEGDMNDHVARKDVLLKFDRNGAVFFSVRKKVKAYCPMEFYDFPMDQQSCELSFESYAYDTKDVRYKWKNGNLDSLSISPRMKITGYSLSEWQLASRTNMYMAGNFSSLIAEFVFKRNVGFHVIQTYTPTALIVVISWVAFWVDEHSVPARISLAITTVLAITTLFFGVQSSLPKVGHVKAIDIYLLGNFLFVFGALVEYALICYVNKRGMMKKLVDGMRNAPASLNECSWEKIKWAIKRPDKQTEKYPDSERNLDEGISNGVQKCDVGDIKDKELRPKDGASFGQRRADITNIKPLLKGFAIDQWARVLFPTAYVIFLVVYILVYTVHS